MTNASQAAGEMRESFFQALSACFNAYKTHGGRSNEKLKPYHGWFAELVEGEVSDVRVQSLRPGDASGEIKVPGKYRAKAVDLAMLRSKDGDEEVVFTGTLKFAMSNVKQNQQNYFEHLIGETANLRRQGVPVAAFTVFRNPCPYLNRNGEVTRTEKLTEEDIQKYFRLMDDDESWPHRPNILGIETVSIDETTGKVSSSDLRSTSSMADATIARLQDEFSLEPFIEKLLSSLSRSKQGR